MVARRDESRPMIAGTGRQSREPYQRRWSIAIKSIHSCLFPRRRQHLRGRRSSSSVQVCRRPCIISGSVSFLAGVIGLTTALRLQELGSNHVTVIADILPSDPKSIRYTSRWAGAHHVFNPMNSDTKLHQLEKETFQILWALSAPGSETEECFLRIPQTEYFFGDRPNATVEGETGGIEPLEAMPEVRQFLVYDYARLTS